MRFLPFIKGQDFLIVYAIFAIIGIIIIGKKLINNDSKDFIILGLEEEKYYVLENKYSLKHMFYYITYKLYAKGILLKDEEEKKFYVNTEVTTYLSSIEEQVYILYLDKFAPKDFESNMVNESEFKGYYDNIHNELITSGLIKDREFLKKNRATLKIGLVIILIPGVLRLIGGIVNDMPVGTLVIELIITVVITKIVLSGQVNGKLTNKGSASKAAYENQYESMINDEDNRNSSATYTGDNMNNFLMGTAWMNVLDINNPVISNSDSSSYTDNSDYNFSDNNDSGSNDSGSSGSSCSSCSSCGGCGGGD